MLSRNHFLYNAAAVATYKARVQALSPVGYWPMDDASGNLTDASGNGWTATANGDPTYQQTGPRVYSAAQDAIDFDGTGDYFTVSSDIDNSATTEMTLGLWFKVPASAVAEWLVNMRDAGVFSWSVILSSGGLPAFYAYQDDGSTEYGVANTGTALDDGTWHHLACWIDSNGYVNVSRDDGTQTHQQTTVSGTWNGATTSGLALGSLNSSGSSPFTGSLAHVAYWDSDIGAAARQTLAGGD